MKTNVYKRFDPRVMEREERIRINRGLPTMRNPNPKITYDSIVECVSSIHHPIFCHCFLK